MEVVVAGLGAGDSGSIRQSACLIVNPNTMYSYGIFYNCTVVLNYDADVKRQMFIFSSAHRGST